MLDLGALEGFLRARGLCDGPVTAHRIGDGHSNLTYLVTDGTNSVVVRRPPPPPIPPGAHDVLREAAFIGALAGTDVPVPSVLATDDRGPFFVMSYVDGPVVTTATPPGLDRRVIGESLVDSLAALHAVDWRAAGLTGRPEGFNTRHVRRLRPLVADAAQPAFAELGDWLTHNAPPESGATIVHNDYRLGNVILTPPGRVAAILDWELATIGDPLFDLAYFLASWPEPGERLTPTVELGRAALEPGYPSRADLGARYAERTGRDLANLAWYTVLALWKLAVLYEYSHRKALDPYYADPALVQSFLTAAQRVI